MESPADYLDSPLVDSDDVAFPCKGCGEILEEGKAFELAGHRWHLDCFRCNTCSTLLDSDANLLLLGDGSLICNNCTYSCSACGNKIEDLAILTGDQAFCATCFRCRNCKRKIENLRYARTSQGIFCMSCHESLMARRRKKSRAAANAKLKKDDQSPMLVDKSLPALPPNAVSQSAFSPDRDTPGSVDNDTPTELSPRPRTTYQHDSSSRSSSRRTRDPSAERTSSDGPAKDGLILPTTTYRNHRHSAISQASDVNGGDGESLFIPLAFDPSPAPNPTPRSTSEARGDLSKKPKDAKENKVSEKDYFNLSKSNGRSGSQKTADSPHIAFQEKGREPSSEETLRIKESIHRAQAGGKGSARGSPVIGSDDVRVQHATSPQSSSSHNKSQTSNEKFRLGDVPKGKKSGTSRSNSQSDYGDTSSRSTSSGGPSSVPSRKESAIGIPQTDSPKSLLATEKAGTPRSSQDSRRREDAGPRSSIDFKNSSNEVQRADSGETGRSIPRKEIPSGAVKTTMSSMGSSSGPETSPSTTSSTDTPGHTPTINGKSISGPVLQSSSDDDLVPPSRAPTRPTGPQQKLSDTYMAPRAPPAPPPLGSHNPKESTHQVNGASTSPNLPRWSAGGDFTMDEDMARILGETDESSQSILRRVSNAVRHGRNNSEASVNIRHQGHGRSVSETTARTVASPRWPKTPTVAENSNPAKDISSPISINSPILGEDPAILRRQLRNSEQRVAELERQFVSEKDLKSLNKKLIEKRKTVSVLDSQTEIMIRQLEVLAGYVEKAKDSKQPLEIAELEDSAIKEFVQKLERLKQTMSSSVESLYEDRNKLLEEKNQVMAETNQIMADRDRALVEFEQLSSKNAQLADMNNDLTHQIQERFKAQSGSTTESPDHQ
ncbi:Rho-type GTPase-activating protein [Lachnellula subtilissima]|uniref:Rho-type GTPase-activating protein n=1 Tax=Lachnellula subtilissima TaxID=602034 RepID=A0A8H8RZ15_9HELO|nr:Rho-type GTPase-activating protein [Lachnellula subtilissima]